MKIWDCMNWSRSIWSIKTVKTKKTSCVMIRKNVARNSFLSRNQMSTILIAFSIIRSIVVFNEKRCSKLYKITFESCSITFIYWRSKRLIWISKFTRSRSLWNIYINISSKKITSSIYSTLLFSSLIDE